MHVERLVLDLPVSQASGLLIGEGIRTELARLVAEEGLPAINEVAGGDLGWEAPTVTWPTGQSNVALANELARSIHTSLGGSQGSGTTDTSPGKGR
jgi:hypothetical protein